MYRIAREAKSCVSIVRSVSGVTANATISARLHVSFQGLKLTRFADIELFQVLTQERKWAGRLESKMTQL